MTVCAGLEPDGIGGECHFLREEEAKAERQILVYVISTYMRLAGLVETVNEGSPRKSARGAVICGRL